LQDPPPSTAVTVGAGFTPPAAWPAAALHARQAFADQLLAAMTTSEKVGQMRLVSIGGDLPRERMLQALAQGQVGGTFNSVTRADTPCLPQAAVGPRRLGIPIFCAYDVVHGHRTIFPIGPGLASTWNLELIEEAAAAMAAEAAADALDMTF